MALDRYLVLGLAHVRSEWFLRVARWATMGTLPIEFVKCVGPTELRAHLRAGRPCAAALLDGDLPAVDRDLIEAIDRAGACPIVVDDQPPRRSWAALGARAVLPRDLGHAALLQALVDHAQAAPAVEPSHLTTLPFGQLADEGPPPTAGGRLVAVVGRSGSGASTIAIAAAQAMATGSRRDPGPAVVLADLARIGHQALLHDAMDLVPGVEELLAATRAGPPAPQEVRDLARPVPTRGYRVLLGLRHRHAWVTVQRRTLRAALGALRWAAEVVVVDADGDLEGEAEVASFDVEDRHLMARATVAAADLVLAVGRPGATGVHGLVLLADDLVRAGASPERIVLVANRAPARPRRRAELARALAVLAERSGVVGLGPTVFVPERPAVEIAHLTVGRLPAAVTAPVGAAVRAGLDRLAPVDRREQEDGTAPIVPGTLGAGGLRG